VKQAIQRATSLAAPTLGAGVLVAAAYARILPEMIEIGDRFHDTPPTGLCYAGYVWSDFFARGFWGWPTAMLFLFGSWRAVRERSRVQVLLGIALLGPTLLALQGVSHYPWGYSRYLIFILPLLLVVVGYGLSGVAPQRGSWMATLVLAAILAGTWVPSLTYLLSRKSQYPWHTVHEYLRSAGGDGALVVTIDLISHQQLNPIPDPPTYTRARLTRLRKPMLEHAPDGPGGKRVFLVLTDVAPRCVSDLRRFGRVSVATLLVKDYRGLLEEMRACLAGIVEGTWPTQAEYAPVYAAIVELDKRLGREDAMGMYAALFATSKAQTLSERWKTGKLRRLEAEYVSQLWTQRMQSRRP
jgi:hypothetical protein